MRLSFLVEDESLVCRVRFLIDDVESFMCWVVSLMLGHISHLGGEFSSLRTSC
jgi:hypothetical protein